MCGTDGRCHALQVTHLYEVIWSRKDFAGGNCSVTMPGAAPQFQMYVDEFNGPDNVWSQPVDGGPRKVVTNFKQDSIVNTRARATESVWPSHTGRSIDMLC